MPRRILITAPLGAVSIIALGPKLLTRDAPEEKREEKEGPSKAWEKPIVNGV